jgi:nucleotide-binding universal stress UspA family protein
MAPRPRAAHPTCQLPQEPILSHPAPGLDSLIAHVFHPTDFSKASDLAFAHSLRIALRARAALTLFHVDQDGDDVRWSDFPAVRETLQRWGLLPAGSPRDAVLDLGVDVEKVRAPAGDPVQAIAAYLREDPADLIVLASHAGDRLGRWRSPSVAEPVAREAHSPTLFLPPGARGFVSAEDGTVCLRRVLIPVDHSPRPQVALSLADRLSRALGAEPQMTILHVGPEDAFPPLHVPQAAEARSVRRVAAGPVPEAIAAAARELDADLVVMTTRGHEGFLDALRGSTTERVLRQAGRALLAIPER